MERSVVFMAAGFGTRFGGGVKQIEPIGPNGEVLMDYAIHDALRAGFDRVVFIIRRDIEADFRKGVGGRTEKKCDVEYVYQDLDDLPEGFSLPEGRQKPWGTGQAVLACRNVLRGPFCVLNADDYYGPEAFRQIAGFFASPPRRAGIQGCMAGYVLGNTLSENGSVTRGVCRVSKTGMLEDIHETRGIILKKGGAWAPDGDEMRQLDTLSTVSMNIWGMPASFIGYLEENFVPFLQRLAPDDVTSEYLLPIIMQHMIHTGRGSIQVLPTDGRWFGMTYAEDKRSTKQKIAGLIADGVYPQKI